MPGAPDQSRTFYITTPIYYVNDRPHIGHVYTTLIADVGARLARLAGRDVFFLTGTDEHAEKVVTSAAAKGVKPIEWADRNAAAFQEAFRYFAISNDDFIRTTQARHIEKVEAYIRRLLASGAIYQGDYEGWWDESQEEYLTETTAREANYKSPVSKKPLVRRREKNYFFKLSAYQDHLLAHIEAHPEFLQPDARRNEVVGRIRQGLQDVPISRAAEPGSTPWGILMPDDPQHRIYVWIDALFNYLSTIDTPERRRYWPANIHALGKDILWFHAVIWPCMLMALGESLPRVIYAHSWWIREGQKMSKSLGNFLDFPTLRGYADAFSLDALRWFLLTQGPLGATDADFAHARFVETYNADLANGVGNAASRVSNMIDKYFGGACPDPRGVTNHAGHDWPTLSGAAVDRALGAIDSFDIEGALEAGLGLVRRVDAYINATEPFKVAKDESRRDELAVILYHCAEALRIAGLILQPAMPTKMADMLARFGAPDISTARLDRDGKWGGLRPGVTVRKGEALFPRADVDAPAPEPVGAED